MKECGDSPDDLPVAMLVVGAVDAVSNSRMDDACTPVQIAFAGPNIVVHYVVCFPRGFNRLESV
jgi:hypothetical protein